MNERTAELKELARTVLVEYDQVMKELNDKEAELKKSHPSEGTLTKIELDADVLNAAKESSAPASTCVVEGSSTGLSAKSSGNKSNFILCGFERIESRKL